MSWKEFLLNLGINTLSDAIAAMVATSGIGPKFKQACLNADAVLTELATAAKTPNE